MFVLNTSVLDFLGRNTPLFVCVCLYGVWVDPPPFSLSRISHSSLSAKRPYERPLQGTSLVPLSSPHCLTGFLSPFLFFCLSAIWKSIVCVSSDSPSGIIEVVKGKSLRRISSLTSARLSSPAFLASLPCHFSAKTDLIGTNLSISQYFCLLSLPPTPRESLFCFSTQCVCLLQRGCILGKGKSKKKKGEATY